MTSISITQLTAESGRQTLESGMNSLADRIRERAYEIYQERGATDGDALEHWLEAERELTVQLESDLVETDGGFELNFAADGLAADSLGVTALRNALAVSGRSGADERVLLACFDLPAAIHVEKVTATLDNGVLRIAAPKADGGEKRAARREMKGAARSAAA